MQYGSLTQRRGGRWAPRRIVFQSAALFCALAAVLLQGDEVAKPAPRLAVVIPFSGVINPRLEQFFERKLNEAKDAGADVVVLEIDSPGGHLDASQRVAARLQHLGWARTVAYIPREALSGAAIV